MAGSISPFSIYGAKSSFLLPPPPPSSSSIDSCRLLPLHRLQFGSQCGIATSYSPVKRFSRVKRIRSVTEEEEESLVQEGAGEDASSSPPVSVPVSASDVLTMFFHVFHLNLVFIIVGLKMLQFYGVNC